MKYPQRNIFHRNIPWPMGQARDFEEELKCKVKNLRKRCNESLAPTASPQSALIQWAFN